MSTTRTVHTAQPGPAVINTNLDYVDVTVHAEPGRTVAELTIHTDDDTGPSADAVNHATLTVDGQVLEARMKGGAGGGGMTVIQTGRGGRSSFSSVNVSSGSIVIGGGTVMVNGRLVSGGQGATVIAGGNPITVVARVPVGSTVTATSVSGDVETVGELAEVDASSTSGDISVDAVRVVNARTVSGDVRVGDLGGTADLSSTSGDITVHGGPFARARARTVSGDVRGTGGLDVDGSSVSGRVRNR